MSRKWPWCTSLGRLSQARQRPTITALRRRVRGHELQMFLQGADMTGRPGYRTMEMIGGSSAPYLARTPCVPLFSTSFNRVGNKERFRLPGAGGGSFPLYGGTFARSYSVSILAGRHDRPGILFFVFFFLFLSLSLSLLWSCSVEILQSLFSSKHC